ncbi:hypothetical protein ACSX1A_18720 [Pontibacter sp. MBLB2868]|uniref:hypothetical protein n=1 Tax=Pontibacter sp. MBLB2868 TaxID=3451555 RepID=UPI003F74B9E0
MSTAVYTYNTGKYFSSAVRAFGWISTIFALLFIWDGSITAWLFLPACLITQFTYYQLTFDLQHMTYREGGTLAGITFGKKIPLQGFEFLYLKKNKYSKIMESRGSMAGTTMEKFDGYLLLTDGTKLHLLQRDKKEKALQEMVQIAQDLSSELRDLTEMKYY